MRVMLKEYASGGHGVFQTTDDGALTIAEWDGPRKPGERICAYIEVACDSSAEGIDRALDGLAWLSDAIRNRKSQLIAAAEKQKAS